MAILSTDVLLEVYEFMITALIVVQLICAVALIVVITMQTGKSSGLGAISGGNDTFFGAGKSKSKDAILATATKWIAGAFCLLTYLITLLS